MAYPSLFGLSDILDNNQGYASGYVAGPQEYVSPQASIPKWGQSRSGMYLDELSKARRGQASVQNPTRKPLASPIPRPGNLGLAIALSLIANSLQKGAGAAGLSGFMQGSQMGAQMQDQNNERAFQDQLAEAERSRQMYDADADVAGMKYQGARADESAQANRDWQEKKDALEYERRLKIDAANRATAGDMKTQTWLQGLASQGFKNSKALRSFIALGKTAGVNIEDPDVRAFLDSELEKVTLEEEKLARRKVSEPSARAAYGALAYGKNLTPFQSLTNARTLRNHLRSDPEMARDMGMDENIIAEAVTRHGSDMAKMDAIDEAVRKYQAQKRDLDLKLTKDKATISAVEAKNAAAFGKAKLNEINQRSAKLAAEAAKDKADANDPAGAAKRRILSDTGYLGRKSQAQSDLVKATKEYDQAVAYAALWEKEWARRKKFPNFEPTNEHPTQEAWAQEARAQADLYTADKETLRLAKESSKAIVKEIDNFASQSWQGAPGAQPEGQPQRQPGVTPSGNRILSAKPIK